jgi:hypothetical protein
MLATAAGRAVLAFCLSVAYCCIDYYQTSQCHPASAWCCRHTEDERNGTCNGHGGTTWNTTLFPDPATFIGWLHSGNNTVGHPLKLVLNLHPQFGVDPCQNHYAEVARATGIDPSSNETVPCNMFSKQYARALFADLYNSEPNRLVDHWWTGVTVRNAFFSFCTKIYVLPRHARDKRN